MYPEGGPGDGGGVFTFSGSGVGGRTTGVIVLLGVDGDGRGGGGAVASVAYELMTRGAGAGFLQSLARGDSGASSLLSCRLQDGAAAVAKSEY